MVYVPKKEDIRDGTTGTNSPHITTKQYRNGQLIGNDRRAMPSKFWGMLFTNFYIILM